MAVSRPHHLARELEVPPVWGEDDALLPPPPDAGQRAPGALLLAMEGRAPLEFVAGMAARPWLKNIPQGDGHTVLVFPGLGASDISTVPLRRFLADRGYEAQRWRQGFNLGPRDGVLDACRANVRHLHERSGRKISLIGWSLGGIYARELAKEMPEAVRCVITLGSPFSGPPQSTNAWRFFEMVSGQSAKDHDMLAQLHEAPPVPTTSIYSRTDGVVAWQSSLNAPSATTENIEVHASHIGMGMNPLALYAVADRLRQDPAHWQRFDPHGAQRWFFKTTHQSPRAAAAAAAA